MKTLLDTHTIYCDMDGVIADFNREKNGVERFATEKGFFENLKPIKKNIKVIKALIEKGAKVKILSATPNERADLDKHKWLDKHLPQIELEDRVFVRNTDNKAEVIKRSTGQRSLAHTILIDDYKVNINSWRENGGRTIKINPDKVESQNVKGKQVNNLQEIKRTLLG